MNTLKSNILYLPDYHVDQDRVRVKLNQNESPLDIPLDLKEKVMQKLSEVGWNRYPTNGELGLRSAIAEYANFPVGGIAVGNGSNEMVQTLLYAACDSGDRIVTVQPGFKIYERIASVMNIDTSEVPLRQDFNFDLKGLIEAGRGARLTILATPNNPTGTVLTQVEARHLADEVEGLLVLDEAYYEFSGETAQEILSERENVIILRTFSKALGLAGLRLGYMLGSENVIRHLNKARLPFSVGSFQQVAGEFVLKNRAWWRKQVDMIIEEREKLCQKLGVIEGIRAVPSKANFILFQSLRMSSSELFLKLFKKGILVRRFDSPGLEDAIRVTIGTPKENGVFLKELGNILSGGNDEACPV